MVKLSHNMLSLFTNLATEKIPNNDIVKHLLFRGLDFGHK